MPTARSTCKAWRARLVGRTLPGALSRALASLARRVEADAPVDSGDLKRSVGATPVKSTPRRISGAVVVTSDHALAVEYGTEERDPDPFFRPAVRQERPRMIAIVRHDAGL